MVNMVDFLFFSKKLEIKKVKSKVMTNNTIEDGRILKENKIDTITNLFEDNEYKNFKGIRKESLRDNMTDIEVILTDLGKATVRDIAKKEYPHGLKVNLKFAKRGDNVSKIARDTYELETGNSAITSENTIGGRYSKNDKIELKQILVNSENVCQIG